MAHGVPRPKLSLQDLSQWPDDGRRHELIDGEHFVTAAPSLRHQVVLRELLTELVLYFRRTGKGQVFPAPLDVVFSDFDVVEPDLVVITGLGAEHLSDSVLRETPTLVVEILSPSTQERDRGLKRRLYEKFGVREYWIVDPTARTVEILRLVERRLEVVAGLGEDEALTTPLLPDLKITLKSIFER